LFGYLLGVEPLHLFVLAGLVVLTFATLALLYNYLMLDNFNASLALSRRVPVALARYAFILLLAVIVSLGLRYVGVLLITALLIVPAATAVNLSRNLRELFWLNMALATMVPLIGQWIAWEVRNYYGTELGISGTVVLVSVSLFLLSMIAGPWLRSRKIA